MHVNDNKQEIFHLNGSAIWGKTGTFILILSLLGMGSLNVATLTSEQVHTNGFNFLKLVLGSVLAEVMLNKLLESSPTVQKTRSVDAATKAIAAEREILAGKHAKLSKDHNDLTEKNRKVMAEHEQLKRVSETRSAAAQKASQRIAPRIAATATRSVVTLTPKMAPYAGAAVVLSVTALDLYDFCETAKDLSELNLAFNQPQADQHTICGLKIPN